MSKKYSFANTEGFPVISTDFKYTQQQQQTQFFVGSMLGQRRRRRTNIGLMYCVCGNNKHVSEKKKIPCFCSKDKNDQYWSLSHNLWIINLHRRNFCLIIIIMRLLCSKSNGSVNSLLFYGVYQDIQSNSQ